MGVGELAVVISLSICLFDAEGLGQGVISLVTFLILQSLLFVGCSLPQFGHSLCGHWVCATLQVSQVWSCS
jgi:hypothetical protein